MNNNNETVYVTDEKEYYERLRQYMSNDNRFSILNGISITEVSKGHAKVEVDITPDHMNCINSIHGGCIFTMCDVAAGAAVFSFGKPAATMDSNIHYLRPGIGSTHLIAESRMIKKGKNVCVAEVLVSDQNDNLIAHSTMSYMIIQGYSLPVTLVKETD